LVLDKERFRYQAYMSDVAGQDIKAHHNDPNRMIKIIRDWLSYFVGPDVILPGGAMMGRRYKRFLADLPGILQEVGIGRGELIYNDYTTLLVGWLRANPWGARD